VLQHVSDHRASIIREPCTVLGSLIMDPLWSETCWSTFKNFIILIVSTYYILCISWTVKCLVIIDARCKHEYSKQQVFLPITINIMSLTTLLSILLLISLYQNHITLTISFQFLCTSALCAYDMKLETANSRRPVTTNINTPWANQTILVDYKQCSSFTMRCGVVLVHLPYHKHKQLRLPNQKCYATVRTIDVALNVSRLYSRNVQSCLLVHRKALQAAVSSPKTQQFYSTKISPKYKPCLLSALRLFHTNPFTITWKIHKIISNIFYSINICPIYIYIYNTYITHFIFR